MKIHKIKLRKEFADDVLYGDKNFEIRFNDRNYEVGDYIHFLVIDGKEKVVFHQLDNELYKITYVLSGWGLQDGYVALGIHRVINEKEKQQCES